MKVSHREHLMVSARVVNQLIAAASALVDKLLTHRLDLISTNGPVNNLLKV